MVSQGTMAMALGAFHLAISSGDTLDMRSRSCVDGSPACFAAQVISESMSAQHTTMLGAACSRHSQSAWKADSVVISAGEAWQVTGIGLPSPSCCSVQLLSKSTSAAESLETAPACMVL